MTTLTPKIGCIANWFGTDRTIAPEAGRQLGKLDWCGIPFCGGLGVVQHITARTILANDLHRHVINLARVVADPTLKELMAARLAAMPFHPDTLLEAQQYCKLKDAPKVVLFDFSEPHEYEVDGVEWAAAYFVTSWMSRAGSSGRADEFTAKQSIRYTAGGGDSNTRYRNAIASLDAWQVQLARCNFTVGDGFEFIERVIQADRKPEQHKSERRGLYLDPPFPGLGARYTHQLTADDQQTFNGQRRLARMLDQIKTYKICVRYYDHPLIRELYPEGKWTYLRPNSKTQTNKEVAELLLVNTTAGVTNP